MQRVRRLFIEFAVIVLGVLVALLMESAWQDRQDHQLAEEYLDRLRDDLADNRGVLETDVAFMRQNCSSAQALLGALTGDAELPAEELVIEAWGAALNYTPAYQTSTWEDLLASGRLGLIESAELRTRIIDLFQADVSTWRPARDSEYRVAMLRTLPGEWMSRSASECLTLTGFGDDWQQCAIERLENASQVAQVIADQPGVVEALNTRMYYACNFPRWLNEYRVRLDALEQALNSTSGVRKG